MKPESTAAARLLEIVGPGDVALAGGKHLDDAGDELETAVSASAVTALTDQSLLRVEGSDAVSFCQGQLTADVGVVGPSRSTIAAWLTPKGRVISLMRVLEHDGALHLQLPRALVESTVRRLRMYVLRADVAIHAVDDRLAVLGVCGTAAAGLLAQRGLVPHPAPGDAVESGGCTVVRIHGEPVRFEAIGSTDALASLHEHVRAATRAVGLDAWRALDVRAGVPAVDATSTETYLPQMLNLQALGGVSFDKGCYVGQEIVARTQYLGRLKRRLYIATANAGATIEPGMPVHAVGADQPAGTILNIARRRNGGVRCLAVIQVDTAEKPLHVADVDGAELELEPLPYALR